VGVDLYDSCVSFHGGHRVVGGAAVSLSCGYQSKLIKSPAAANASQLRLEIVTGH
jgi:hypothetical protein